MSISPIHWKSSIDILVDVQYIAWCQINKVIYPHIIHFYLFFIFFLFLLLLYLLSYNLCQIISLRQSKTPEVKNQKWLRKIALKANQKLHLMPYAHTVYWHRVKWSISKIREKIVGWKLIFDTPIMCNLASNEQVQEKKILLFVKAWIT